MGCRSLMMHWRGFSWALYVMASGVLLVSFLGFSCSRRLLGTRLALLICFLISSRGYFSSENAGGDFVGNTYNDLVCKITLYIYCVGRAMSICITYLLGCFQCILIVPSPCKWLHLRENLLKNLSSVMISFCHTVVYNFCCMVFPSHLLYLGNGSVSVTRDLFFLGIMTLSSCYLLSMFYQHGKQAKHLLGLHTKHVEIQAAKAVVALLIMYLLCFGLDSLFWVYTLCMYPVSLSLIDARMFLDSCYSAISSLLIILTNKKVQTGLKCATRRRQCHKLNRHI
uniref:Vomeronasal type-1 receptor n=1 Tax=Gopherus evgoodei TaxID=1825980 RepID=A0A8C4VMR8_9SAUR